MLLWFVYFVLVALVFQLYEESAQYLSGAVGLSDKMLCSHLPFFLLGAHFGETRKHMIEELCQPVPCFCLQPKTQLIILL